MYLTIARLITQESLPIRRYLARCRACVALAHASTIVRLISNILACSVERCSCDSETRDSQSCSFSRVLSGNAVAPPR